MMKKQILETIQRHNLVKLHQHIVLGLSGGPDSVCLFHVFLELAKEMDLHLYPVHVNHKFRPGAAEEDQAYVEQLCETAGFSCRTFVIDCVKLAEEEHLTPEEAGRKARYCAFAEVADQLVKRGISRSEIVIAVGHNADDQAETILFRLLRGAGTDGLSGMRYSRFDETGNRIIRPLLDVKREEIMAYCKVQNLLPRMDSTNEEEKYTRNKIRLSLIPHLEQEYNPAVKDTMIRMGKAAACDSDFLWQQAQDVYEKLVKKSSETHVLLDGRSLKKLHRAIRQRVLARACADLGLSQDLAWTHFENCEAIVFHEGPSASCSLPKGYRLQKWYKDIDVMRPFIEAGENLPALEVYVLSKEAYDYLAPVENRRAVFDYDALTQAYDSQDLLPEKSMTLGFRQTGDYIALSEGKTKKLQDYFVDQKIPKSQRPYVPLLKIGREVLWVLPCEADPKGRFSGKYKLCGTTKKVICIEIIC